jgi:hypothetical protein
MRMYIVCKNCSTRLSNSVDIRDIADRNDNLEQDFVQTGQAIQEDGSCCWTERKGDFYFNKSDVINTRLTEDAQRLNGCCGLDGCDGPNLHCANCGAYVATTRTDCWTPHYTIFEHAETSVEIEDFSI